MNADTYLTTVSRDDFDAKVAEVDAAKRLIVDVYGALDNCEKWEVREMIERRTGSWFAFGVNRDAPEAAPALQRDGIEVTVYPLPGQSGFAVQKKNEVRATHRPSGLFAVSSSRRGDHANREVALAELAILIANAPLPPIGPMTSMPAIGTSFWVLGPNGYAQYEWLDSAANLCLLAERRCYATRDGAAAAFSARGA